MISNGVRQRGVFEIAQHAPGRLEIQVLAGRFGGQLDRRRRLMLGGRPLGELEELLGLFGPQAPASRRELAQVVSLQGRRRFRIANRVEQKQVRLVGRPDRQPGLELPGLVGQFLFLAPVGQHGELLTIVGIQPSPLGGQRIGLRRPARATGPNGEREQNRSER